MPTPTEPTAAQGRCLCAERDLLGDHEEPCAGFGSRSDELCEQAEREAVAAGEWPPESPAASPSLFHFWMENGEVAFQVQVRVWRVSWMLTVWKESGHV